MTAAAFPLYHWSLTERRPRIQRRGLVPGSLSRDGLWRPPYVCFSSTPSLAWTLSGGLRGTPAAAWDLWMLWSDAVSGYEEIREFHAGTHDVYVKEVRVYERIFKRDLWYVATRTT